MSQVDRLGWLQLQEQTNNLITGGGLVYPFLSAAALNVGELVWVSSDFTVNKSAVATDHIKRVGVIVTGEKVNPSTNNPNSWEAVLDPIAIAAGLVAASGAGQQVLVCFLGVAYVITDAAITAGAALSPSTTVAGRARPATLPVVATGAVAVTSAAVNGAGTITGDGFSRIAGMLLEASSGAGQAKRALIGLA